MHCEKQPKLMEDKGQFDGKIGQKQKGEF